MFVEKGGSFHSVNKKIRKHEQVPFVTPVKICIKSCAEKLQNIAAPSGTPAPDRLAYAVAVKLMNLAEGFDAPRRGSNEFNELSNTISDTFNGVLNKVPGYHKVDVLEFEKYVVGGSWMI